MQKPPVAIRRVNQRALVRAVDGRAALGEHDLFLVRTVDAARAKDNLPAHRDAARWRGDVVKAVALVQLRAFERRQLFIDFSHYSPTAGYFRGVGSHRTNVKLVSNPSARAGIGIGQVSLTIVIPKRTRVDESFAAEKQMRLRPFA